MIVLYNPHIDDFLGAPLHFKILGRRPLRKYGFFLAHLLKNDEKVAVCIDGSLSGFIPAKLFCRFPSFLRTAISRAEFFGWTILNRIESRRFVHVATTAAKTSDVLLAFSYKAAGPGFQRRKLLMEEFGAVVFHLSHYFISTAEKAANIKSLSNAFLAGDSDLSDNNYFRKFFPWYRREFLVLSFAVEPRFKLITPFNQRLPRAVATGSMHDLTKEAHPNRYVDYIRESGLDTYHPTRKLIHLHQRDLGDLVSSHVSYYRNYGESVFTRFFSKFRISQSKYFAIDMVALYNEYKFAIVGEEFSGFPALGAFEAMACGALLIAKSPAYEGIGILPNVHFMEHDGSLPSIRAAIIRGIETECASIAENGREFVAENLSPAIVAARWARTLSGLAAGREVT